MFAWSLVGIELEVLTSHDKLKLSNKSLEVYQMLVQHIARDNSGLSLARREDATCFLRSIMSVMTDSTIQMCHQKAMGSKTLEWRISTVILNVHQSTGTEIRVTGNLMEYGDSTTRSSKKGMTCIVI